MLLCDGPPMRLRVQQAVADGGESAWLGRRLVVAEDLADKLAAKLGMSVRRLGAVPGAALEGCTYRHPLAQRTSAVVIGGDYITADSGTGLVHTAPGHGQEDYLVRADRQADRRRS
jgi:isoleucyl-tRNA synthetase